MSLWKRVGGGGGNNGTNEILKYKTILLGDPKNAKAHEKLGLIYFKQAMEEDDSDSDSSSSSDDESDETPRSTVTTESQKKLKLERKIRDKKNLKHLLEEKHINILQASCDHLFSATTFGTNTAEVWFSLGRAQHALWEYTWDDVVDEDGDGIDDRLQEAQTSFQNAFKFPLFLSNAKLYFQVAVVYEDFGSFEGALQMYSHILTSFPDYPGLGTTLLRAATLCMHPRLQMINESVRYWEFLLDSPPVPYSASSILFQLGRAYQLQGGDSVGKSNEAFRECYKIEHNCSIGVAAKNYKKWLSSPETWYARAKFHKENKLYILAADSYLTSIRLGLDDNVDLYIDCCICLRRMLEKDSGLEIMTRAYQLKPYDPFIRNKLRVYSTDWEDRLEAQDDQAIKIQALVRGVFQRMKGRKYMVEEKIKRKILFENARKIQVFYRYNTWRVTFHRNRALIKKSLDRIRLRHLEHCFDIYHDWYVRHKKWRLRRTAAAQRIQRWYRGQIARIQYEEEKRENERKVKIAVKKIQYRLAHQAIKAWDAYVVWIIEVKEPFNATTIQCWWKHMKWKEQFLRNRALILKSLERIRRHHIESTFAQLYKMVQFQKMVRINRRKRWKDKMYRQFKTWKWYKFEYLPWWYNKERPARRRMLDLSIRKSIDKLVDPKELRIIPRPIGDSFLAKHEIMPNSLRIVSSKQRALNMYNKLVDIWLKVYGQSGERELSFMNARLPKDSFFKPGSKYFEKDVQLSLLQKEIEPERQIIHPYKQQLLKIERKFVEVHKAEMDRQPPKVPHNVLVLTLKSNLRKYAGGYDTTKGRLAKQKMKLRRLTGKKAVVQLKPFNGRIPKPMLRHKDEHKTFWGFPEWYGPGEYGKLETLKRSIPGKEERKLEAGELMRMQKVELEQRNIDMKLLLRSKEDDLIRFEKASFICGPMKDSGLFFSTITPGRLYQQKIYKSVTRVQLWWLILIPLRRERKSRSAIMIQKIFRASQGRWWLRLEKLVILNRELIRKKRIHQAFGTWLKMMSQLHLARRMIKRAMNMQLTVRWNAWYSFYEKRRLNRLKKLQKVMKRMLNSKLWRTLGAWYDYVEQQRKVKRLMWKVLSGTKLYFFDEWASNVEIYKENRRRQKNSITIQKSWRGSLGRDKAFWLKYRRTKLAKHIQRIVRGFLGRRHVYYFKIELDLNERKSMRKKLWTESRDEKMNNRNLELKRLEDEKKHLEEIHSKALDDHRNKHYNEIMDRRTGNVKKKEKRYTKEEKAKAREFKKEDTKLRNDFIKRHNEIKHYEDVVHGSNNDDLDNDSELDRTELYSPPEILSTKEYLVKAREFLILQHADEAKENAKKRFREENPPNIICEKCHLTFHDQYGLDVHVCRALANIDEKEEMLSTNTEDAAEEVEVEGIPIGDNTDEEVKVGNETTPDDTKEGFISEDAGGQVSVSGI